MRSSSGKDKKKTAKYKREAHEWRTDHKIPKKLKTHKAKERQAGKKEIRDDVSRSPGKSISSYFDVDGFLKENEQLMNDLAHSEELDKLRVDLPKGYEVDFSKLEKRDSLWSKLKRFIKNIL